TSSMAESFAWIPHRARLHELAARYRRPDRWEAVSAELDRAIACDAELAREARAVRELTFQNLRPLPVAVPPSLLDRFAAAYARVPRERFVLPEDIALSVEDEPVPIEPGGMATVSAPHAYLLTAALLPLDPGDRLLELGTGTGYGAALARLLVGPTGRVTTVELDARLHARAARLLAGRAPDEAPVLAVAGDAADLARELMEREQPNKVAFTFAIGDDPRALVELLPEGGALVAPVGAGDAQELVRFANGPSGVRRTTHGGVRYVTERHFG
ncbi:MAG TPA: hypothetical protein VHB21_11510, partial [Minicystis sp.]|nr:hypothetical protein [Minicystis sp.]